MTLLLIFILYIFPTLVGLLLVFTSKADVKDVFGTILLFTSCVLLLIGIPKEK